MATKENRRQKQLAKKKKKRKEKKALILRTQPSEKAWLIKTANHAADYPIYECLVTADNELFERGIGTLILSRQTDSGEIAIGTFLLDVFCLGVKDAFFQVLAISDYKDLVNGVRTNETLSSTSPACARKLVEDTIAFADNIGFKPHPDFLLARKIFADIDASECTDTWEFGRDGKPFYIRGPNDNQKRVASIMATLEKQCGEGNFDYLLEIDMLE